MTRRRSRRRRLLWLMAAAGVILAAAGIGFAVLPDEEDRARERLHQQLVERFETILPRAEAGEAAAQYAIGEHYQKGLGVERDAEKAMAWYRKAADQAHAGAQYAIGALYENGDGVRQDFTKAAQWYELAANMGNHPGAEFALGRMFYRGRGVASDPSEALKWIGRAAGQGHPAAQHLMGLIYETGWGVETDLAEAYKWLLLASGKSREVMAIDKDLDPVAARDALAKRMTRFDRERGEQMAKAWKPGVALAARLPTGTSLVGTHPKTETRQQAAPPPRKAFRVLALDAPVKGNRTETVTLSLLVELTDPALAPAVCAMAPRVRDAVFGELWSRPVPMIAGRPDLQTLPQRLLDPVNTGLGQPVAKSVTLFSGDRPLDPNDVLQTPYDSVEECDGGTGTPAP